MPQFFSGNQFFVEQRHYTATSLRIQITDTQKVRSDLMKWKLVIVAGLGAAGLGFQNTTFEQKHILLCFVPFVCIYVDALCAHLSLRIKAIGEFLVSREPKSEIEEYVRDYEKFLRISPPTFRLETIALHWTTIFFSISCRNFRVCLFIPKY